MQSYEVGRASYSSDESSSSDSESVVDDSSDASTDPLATSDDEDSLSGDEAPSVPTPTPFGEGVLMRSALMDNGRLQSVRLQPAVMSLFSSTCYITELNGTRVASMKTESTGWTKLTAILGGVISGILLKTIAANETLNPRKASTQMWEAAKKILDEQSVKAKATRFMRTLYATKGTAVAITFGTAVAVGLLTRKPRYSYQNSAKQTQLTGRWKKARKAFVIEYTQRKDMEDVPMVFFLKMNEATKSWDLFKEIIGDGMVADLKRVTIKEELDDDMHSAQEDDSLESRQSSKKAADKKQLTSTIAGISAYGDVNIADIDDSGSVGDGNDSDSDGSVIDFDRSIGRSEERHKQQAQTDEPFAAPEEFESKQETLIARSTASKLPLMSIPGQWRTGTAFTTPRKDFTFDVETLNRFKINIGPLTLSTPLIGSSEAYTMTFTGRSDVPRDVTAFCTYIVRTANTVSLDLIIYTCLLTGAFALLYGLVAVISKVVKGESLSELSLKRALISFASDPAAVAAGGKRGIITGDDPLTHGPTATPAPDPAPPAPPAPLAP